MKSRTAFTKKDLIVFLICVCFVLLNLAAIGSSGREAAKKAICLANVRGVMLATRSYCSENDDFLPNTIEYNRSWPHLSILDFQLLLINSGLDVRKLHCPADQDRPGSLAWWFQRWYHPMTIEDHFDLNGNLVADDVPLGVDPEVNYSYYYPAKMYWDVVPDEDFGWILPEYPHIKRSWKISDITYPDRLIAYFCFVNEDESYQGSYYQIQLRHTKEAGYLSGFVDGHSAWIPWTQLDSETQNAAYGGDDYPYNPDWTVGGIKGYDVLE